MAVTVLLIDDNIDQITITKKTLAKDNQDYRFDSAADAKEGLEKLKAGHYEIVLCDYRLPDVSGLEVLKQLKARGSDCPFIIVTSMGNERLAVEAMKLGASDYIVKDSSYEEILPEVIRQSLERSQEKRERERLEAERNAAVEALKKEKEDLKRMNSFMVDREERLLELKQEVNALLEALGKPKKYQI